MAQGFDTGNSWSSMTEQFRRVFGDDFVQNLMKSINLSELTGGNPFGGAAGARPGMGAGEAGGSGGATAPTGMPGMPGFPGMPGMPGMPNMQGFPFGGASAMPGAGNSGSGAGTGGAGPSMPRADVVQTRHEVVVWLELPGAEPGDVKLSATSDSLRVKGTLRRPYAMASDDQLALGELPRGEFTRDIPLPARVKADKIRANYRQGLLEVRMLKIDPEHAPRGQDIPIRFD